MPCLLVALILLFPRIAIVLLYLFTGFFQGVFSSVLIPLLGFLFLPLTLIAYTFLVKNQYPTADVVFLLVMFVAVVLDLGLLSGSRWRRRAN